MLGQQSRNAEGLTQLIPTTVYERQRNATMAVQRVRHDDTDFPIVKDVGSHLFLVEYTMQGTLKDVCEELKIAKPTYRLRDVRLKDNVRHYHYSLSINTHMLGSRLWWGDYSPCEHEAREDVARKVLTNLMFATGKDVGDYNYYNMAKLQKEVKNLKHDIANLREEISSLGLENACLQEEIRLLNFVDSSG
ncbi:hypothetical protein SESBI_26840 [Sesbania bispinosa]|nr:hypothetical protein SESBI_26840 [Sesbania bispinosa]